MRKLCKLAATALVLAVVVFLLAGCGGGDDEEDNAPPPKEKSNGSGSASSAPAESPSSQLPETLIGQAVVPTDDSPDDFTRAIEDGFPVVVTFYLPLPFDDDQVRSSILSLQGRYRGQAEFLTYLYSDYQSYGDLVRVLNVNTTPTVVIINGDGQVQRAWTGYADSKSLEQGIVEAIAGV
jgi:hypothetical protein